MRNHDPHFTPTACPNDHCPSLRGPAPWRWKRFGFFLRHAPPRRVQRFRCLDCGRAFSTQTFRTTYWLKRPDIQPHVFLRLVECGALRQVGRGLGVVHSTVLRQAERLGRHCLLFQRLHAPRALPDEPLALDGLRTFEYSQYWPCDFHLLVGTRSHFLHGFQDAELRRSGRMRPDQRARRKRLEARFGRPDPRATLKAVTALLEDLVPRDVEVTLVTDQERALARAIGGLNARGWRLRHVQVSSKDPRTPQNPLFAANVADLLIRHSSANQKRETIAFSRRRQSAAERLAIFQVWRNFMKPRAERRPKGPTPAMAVGAAERALGVEDVLATRLFASRMELPERLRAYYERRVVTRQVPNGRRHELKYAR